MTELISKEDCQHNYVCIYRHPTSDVKCTKCGDVLTHAEHAAYRAALTAKRIAALPPRKPYLNDYDQYNEDGHRVIRDPAIQSLLEFVEREMQNGYNATELLDIINGTLRLVRSRMNMKLTIEHIKEKRGDRN